MDYGGLLMGVSTDWHVKHRAACIEDIAGNAKMKQEVAGWMKTGVPKAVLVVGESGCGKTTFARIFQSMVECGDLDFHEYNAGDDRSIDNMRQMLRSMAYMPSAGKASVWFLDECGALLKAAQEAILKGLEEPPKHAYVILATTDPNQLLPTLKRRCRLVTMEPPTEMETAKRLYKVCVAEDVDMLGSDEDKEALKKLCVDIACVNRAPGFALPLLQTVMGLQKEQRAKYVKDIADDSGDSVADLCKLLLLRPESTMKELVSAYIVSNVPPETARRKAQGYMSSILFNAYAKPETMERAYQLLKLLERPWFDNGRAQMLTMLYEVTKLR
jgi:replication-associated recombination protein RarA